MKKTSLSLFIFKLIKKNFLEAEKEDLKEVVQQRILEDSKSLVLSFFAFNISCFAIVISLAFFLLTALRMYGFERVLSLAIVSGVVLLVSLSLFIYCIYFLKKKVKIYKNISTIKNNTYNFSWLDPVKEQLRIEQAKMRSRTKKRYRLRREEGLFCRLFSRTYLQNDRHSQHLK